MLGHEVIKLLFPNELSSIKLLNSIFYLIQFNIQSHSQSMMLKRLKYYTGMAKQNIRSLYPFEYTFYPSQYKYRDPRFQQFAVLQQLFLAEQQHIAFVLNSFEQLISKGHTESPAKQFIHQSLVNLVHDYRNYLNAQQAKIQFILHKQTFIQSVGFLEYYGLQQNLFMHQYTVNRKDEKVTLAEKEELRQTAKKSVKDQLQQDIKDIQKENSLGQKFKEKFLKDKHKKSEGVMKIWDFFQNSYRKSKEIKKFEPYTLVSRIDGKMSVKLQDSSKAQQFLHLDITTKWLYNITSDQPESVRKSRKRILFDFQFWKRGCLIPVKDFTLL